MKIIYETDLKKIGSRIRYARNKLRITQEHAAEQMSKTGQYWCLIETGKERASICTYQQICKILGLTLNDIFYDDAANMLLHKAFAKESLLLDCTDNEKAIISEIVLALKDSLKRNR